MIQYKEKSSKQQGQGNEDAVSVGLFDYPVLMAADILLYQAQLVPVGEDQRQHLELARDICRRFNDQYPHLSAEEQLHSRLSSSLSSLSLSSSSSPSTNKKKKQKNIKQSSFVFCEPEALVLKQGARLMSLQDGCSKMSKSHEGDGSRINLLDSPDVILKKIKRCKTDNISRDMTFHDTDRPESSNLLNIYQTMTGQSPENIEREVAGMQWGQFKPLLAEAIIEHLAPMQREYSLLMQDEVYIEQVLRDGQDKASVTANHTLKAAKQALGMYLPP
jgi:tryptophanyl-tRNA synthetase